MISPAPTLIFDLDGTLVDTAPDLLAALNAVLARAGHRTYGLDDVRHLVGRGARMMFEYAYADTGTVFSSEDVERHTDEFIAHYRENIAIGSRPFPHVRETLDRLSARGARLGISTNKPHDLTLLLLDKLHLARHFGAVQGFGVQPYNKPDARALTDVIAALSGEKKTAIMIGDSPTDVAAARAAEIPVIAVSFGYSPVPAQELGADVLVDDFRDLPRAIARLLNC